MNVRTWVGDHVWGRAVLPSSDRLAAVQLLLFILSHQLNEARRLELGIFESLRKSERTFQNYKTFLFDVASANI